MTMVINMTTAISGNPGIKRRKTKKEAKTNASLDALIENDGLQLFMVAYNHHYNQQRFSSFFVFHLLIRSLSSDALGFRGWMYLYY